VIDGRMEARERIVTAGLATLVLASLIGCALAPPIVLEGTPGDLEQLVGQWEGRYTAGRKSTIRRMPA
jgi:hypothetical protein